MIIHKEGCDGIRCNCDKLSKESKEYIRKLKEQELSDKMMGNKGVTLREYLEIREKAVVKSRGNTRT